MLPGETKLSHYPLMFTFRDAIAGNGFLAGITLSGRALMTQEDKEWWLYGVSPGAIAENGRTPQETYLRFRNRYKGVLFDVAEGATNFKTFKKEVEQFFHAVDQEEDRRWTEALQAIRSRNLEPESPFSELPREKPEDRPLRVEILRLDKAKDFRPSYNVPDTYAVPIAA